MPTRVAVSCAQLDGQDGSRQQRLRSATDAIAQGADAAAKEDAAEALVVLPELWPVGFFHFDDYASSAESMDGMIVSAVRTAARAAGCWVLGGSYIERSAAGLHNTTILVDPAGELVSSYRKTHLFGYESAEADLLVPGDQPGCVETSWGKVGILTCYDLRFPELSRDLVDRGAQVLAIVSAWPAPRIEHWRTLLRARAVENQAWVIGCNTTGSDAGTVLGGHSTVVAPDGRVVAEAGQEACRLTSVIDTAEADQVRARMPFLDDRRYSLGMLPHSPGSPTAARNAAAGRLTFAIPGGSTAKMPVASLLNAGWTGRDQASVDRHIAELAAIGVSPPSETPTLYVLSNHLASQQTALQVQHANTSAEVEYALVIADGGDVLVTLASDHSDRALEAHSVRAAKQAYPDLLASEAWRLAEVVDHWDTLVLRCWAVDAEENRTLYQESPLAELLAPAHWLDLLSRRGERRSGTVLLSGTVPVRAEGELAPVARWEAELEDPETGARLTLSYKVERLPAGIADD